MTIRETRSKLGLTQQQMADLLGMSQQGVSRIETGYESRSETRQILHHLAAIDIVAEVGLLDVLKANVQRVQHAQSNLHHDQRLLERFCLNGHSACILSCCWLHRKT